MSQIQNGAQLIKDAADIVEVINEVVPLQNRSGRFLGLCPFHSEKTPSFTVNKDRGFFHCFGCKESGDVISFVMKYNNMSFVEALQELA
nr:CHC2 zinc finger domain-containing protein [Spirochaetales bacterium]